MAMACPTARSRRTSVPPSSRRLRRRSAPMTYRSKSCCQERIGPWAEGGSSLCRLNRLRHQTRTAAVLSRRRRWPRNCRHFPCYSTLPRRNCPMWSCRALLNCRQCRLHRWHRRRQPSPGTREPARKPPRPVVKRAPEEDERVASVRAPPSATSLRQPTAPQPRVAAPPRSAGESTLPRLEAFEFPHSLAATNIDLIWRRASLLVSDARLR